MTRFFWLLIGLAFLGSTGAAEPEKAWRITRGAEIQKLFADQDLGDGVHYAYRFKSNGTFAGTETGKDVRGTWRTTARQTCWTWIKPARAKSAMKFAGKAATSVCFGTATRHFPEL